MQTTLFFRPTTNDVTIPHLFVYSTLFFCPALFTFYLKYLTLLYSNFEPRHVVRRPQYKKTVCMKEESRESIQNKLTAGLSYFFVLSLIIDRLIQFGNIDDYR